MLKRLATWACLLSWLLVCPSSLTCSNGSANPGDSSKQADADDPTTQQADLTVESIRQLLDRRLYIEAEENDLENNVAKAKRFAMTAVEKIKAETKLSELPKVAVAKTVMTL